VDDTSVSVDATTDFTANGNTLTYTATGLPAGVTIASNGIISGTPTAASSGTIVITGQDEYGRETTSTTSHTTALRTQATGGVDLDLSFPEDSAISSTDLVQNWTANGNTLSFVSVSPALPTGLSIDSSGTMTGTPTTVTADATYTLTMEDEYGRETTDTFTLEITAASAFTPADLFGVGDNGVWYDVHPDYCYTDAGKTTNATVGDSVYVLEDRSGNGNDATQATAANRPVLRQDGSSNYYLEFDGITDYLEHDYGTVIGSTTADYTSVQAIKFDTSASTQVVGRGTNGGNGNGENSNFDCIVAYSSPAYDFYRSNNEGGSSEDPITSLSAEFGTTNPAVVTLQKDGTSGIARKDGVSRQSITVSSTLSTFAATSAWKYRIGINGGFGGNGLDGRFYGRVFINRALNSTEIDDTETYIANLSGVTL